MTREATNPIVPITQQLYLLGLWWLFPPHLTILATQSIVMLPTNTTECCYEQTGRDWRLSP